MLRFERGDATSPQRGILVHVCNDIGGWGKGFVLAISKRWEAPEREYRAWAKQPGFALGGAQIVPVGDELWVANVVAQHGVGMKDGVPPIRYDALERGLQSVAAHALAFDLPVHMPRIGCGLAGGRWEAVEPIVDRTLVSEGIEVTVFDWP